jgi:hypothetical protein
MLDDVFDRNVVRWVSELTRHQPADNRERPARLFEDLMDGEDMSMV